MSCLFSILWNTSERQRRSLIYRYVPWFMANGERAALEPPTDEPVRPPLPSWAAELSDAQRDALAGRDIYSAVLDANRLARNL